MRKKLGANAWPILIPLGKEDYLKGQLDVVNKKAIIYSDNDEIGSTYEVTDIPRNMSKRSTRLMTISSSKFRISTTRWPRPSSTKSRSRRNY